MSVIVKQNFISFIDEHDMEQANISVNGLLIRNANGDDVVNITTDGDMLIGTGNASYASYQPNLTPAFAGKINGVSITALNRKTIPSQGVIQDALSFRQFTNNYTASRFKSVVWSPSDAKFFGITDTQIISSDDGSLWEAEYSLSSDVILNDIVYSPELQLYVTLYNYNSSYSSSIFIFNFAGDLAGLPAIQSTESLTSVTWSPELGLFCAVGTSNTVVTSSDGMKWDVQDLSQISEIQSGSQYGIVDFNSIVWSPELSLFCVGGTHSSGYPCILTSQDGINWSLQTLPSVINTVIHTITWSPELNLFCACGRFDFLISSDGINWSTVSIPIPITQPSGTERIVYKIIWISEFNLFCAVGEFTPGITPISDIGMMLTSPDGVHWNYVDHGYTSHSLHTVTWSPDLNILLVSSLDWFSVGRILLSKPVLPSPLNTLLAIPSQMRFDQEHDILHIGPEGNQLLLSNTSITTNGESLEIITGQPDSPITFIPGGAQTSMYLQPDGKVGIGEMNPSYKLEVDDGSVATSHSLIVSNGNESNGKGEYQIKFNYNNVISGDTYSHFINSRHQSGAGGDGNALDFYLYKGGATANNDNPDPDDPVTDGGSTKHVMTLYGNGNVGIGTTSPDYMLDVKGSGNSYMQISSDGQMHDAGLYFRTPNTPVTSAKAAIIAEGKDDWSRSNLHFCLDDSSGGNANDAEYIADYNTNARMTILSNGNVGIGETDPDYKLEVNGNIKCSDLYVGPSDGSGTIFLGGGDSGDFGYDNSVIESRLYDSNTQKTELLLFKGDNEKGSIGPDRIRLRAGQICFDTYSTSQFSNSNKRVDEDIKMVVNGDGKVGIGTTSTNHMLEINQSGTESNYAACHISQSFSYQESSVNFSNMIIENKAAHSILELKSSVADQNMSGCQLRFNIILSNTWQDGSPNQQRAGLIACVPESTNNYEDSYMNFYTHRSVNRDGIGKDGELREVMRLQSDLTTRMYGPLFINGSTTVSSDERIKNNIKNLNDLESIQILRRLQPKTYNYLSKDKTNTTVYGFIAQEVSSVLPYAVQTTSMELPGVQSIAILENNTLILQSEPNVPLQIDDTICIPDLNHSKQNCVITSVSNSTAYTISVPDNTTLQSKFYVEGKLVDDFHVMNKNAIFTITTAAVQELDRQVQNLTVENAALQEQITNLTLEHRTLKTHMDAIESRLNTLESQ